MDCDSMYWSCYTSCLDDPINMDSCLNSCDEQFILCSNQSQQPEDSSDYIFSLSDSQVSGIGDSLIQGGSSVLSIGLSLLPYIICFTVILIIWLVIKRLSNLDNKL